MSSGAASLVAIVAGAVLSGACVVKEDEPEGQSGPVYAYPSESDFCTELGRTQCNAEILKACKGDEAVCVSKRGAVELCRQVAGATQDWQALRYYPEPAEHCIEIVEKVYADAALSVAEVREMSEACIGVFSEGRGDSAPCEHDRECDAAAGLRCVLKPSSESGTCQVPIAVPPGEDCSDPKAVCDTGYYCDSGDHCVSAQNLGKECGIDKPCKPELRCEAAEEEDQPGTCVNKGAQGSACTSDEDCTGFCFFQSGTSEGALCSDDLTFETFSATCDTFH